VILIDPPVGPFSAAADIEEWITYLRTLGDAPEVREAIADAEGWIAAQGGRQ